MAKIVEMQFVGYATDSTQHVMAPPELVYEPVRPPTVNRKIIPWDAKLWGLFIIACVVYGTIQGSINTFG